MTSKKLSICRGLSHPVMTFLFGVALPTASITMEMYVGVCAEVFGGDLSGNMFQYAVMSSVPILNFIAWLCCLKGWGAGNGITRAMCGFSFGIAVVYAFALLPLALFGTIF